MDIHGHSWTSIGIHRLAWTPWTFMDFMDMSMDIRGHSQASMEIHEIPRPSLDPWDPSISMRELHSQAMPLGTGNMKAFLYDIDLSMHCVLLQCKFDHESY